MSPGVSSLPFQFAFKLWKTFHSGEPSLRQRHQGEGPAWLGGAEGCTELPSELSSALPVRVGRWRVLKPQVQLDTPGPAALSVICELCAEIVSGDKTVPEGLITAYLVSDLQIKRGLWGVG